MYKSSTKGISQPHNLTTIPRSVGRPADVEDLNGSDGSGKNAIKVVKIPTCPTTDCFNETSTGNNRDFANFAPKHLGFSMLFLQMFHEKNSIGFPRNIWKTYGKTHGKPLWIRLHGPSWQPAASPTTGHPGRAQHRRSSTTPGAPVTAPSGAHLSDDGSTKMGHKIREN